MKQQDKPKADRLSNLTDPAAVTCCQVVLDTANIVLANNAPAKAVANAPPEDIASPLEVAFDPTGGITQQSIGCLVVIVAMMERK